MSEAMSESQGYQRYCITLTVVEPEERDKFHALDRSSTYREIRPNRSPGQRGAYSVELSQEEYEQALRDAEDPDVNLIVVEPDSRAHDTSTVPGTAVDNYMAMQNADTLGLTGAGVDVGIIELGYGAMLTSVMGSRIKATGDFGADPYDEGTGHGARMIGLAVPEQSRVAAAAFDGTGSRFAEAMYWAVDEIGIDVMGISQYFDTPTTAVEDAINHAYAMNVLLLISAGNGTDNNGIPTTTLDFPAYLANVLTISNYNPATDAIYGTSNYGPKIWAASAGASLRLYTPSGSVESSDLGGTSAACQVAAGLSARFMSGGNSAGNTRTYLANNARKTGASPAYEGNGVLQLASAINELQNDKPDKENLDGTRTLADGGLLCPDETDLPAGTVISADGTTATLPDESTLDIGEDDTVIDYQGPDGVGTSGGGGAGACG